MTNRPRNDRASHRPSLLWVVILWSLTVALVPSPARPAADLFVRDSTADTGVEPNPGTGAMWVSPDVWVRNTPDPNYDPRPYPIGSPTWTPQPHEDPGYDDPKTGFPAYVYVRVRNRGNTASTGTERLRVYWAKASTGLGWSAQWVDYVDTTCGPPILHGMEITKPRENAALASAAERQAYLDALLDIDANTLLQFSDGVQYWDKQNAIHDTGGALHGVPGFLPWHREFLNRLEVLMRESDPILTLLYWDWTTDPRTGYGVNLFTTSFMGASSGTVGAPLVPLRPPTLQRDVGASFFSPDADSTVLAETLFPGLRTKIENGPNHNYAHGYIGGASGQISQLNTAASDPFFFFLHGNVDRLWAQWQRDPTVPGRLDPATAYGTDATSTTITSTMNPWAGGTISPWTNPSEHYAKAPLHGSVVTPPIYDTAPLVIPVLQPNEEVVLQVPWFPPDPNDFSCFGDSKHFCLLARIETATSYPFGMTYPEVTSVYTNTKNNNNIAWKNVTVQGDFDRPQLLVGEILRNFLDRPERTRLLFAVPKGPGGPSVFDYGEVRLILPPGWGPRAGTYAAEFQDVTLLGETARGTELVIGRDGAYLDLPLDALESFPVQLELQLPPDTEESVRQQPFPLDLVQRYVDDPEYLAEPTVGGQRYTFDLSKLTLVAAGSEWAYLADGSVPAADWVTPGFDDGGWPRGRAPFELAGYAAAPAPVTTYFRQSFTAADPGLYYQVRLRLQVDDGAVVYLNGNEVYRRNLPGGVTGPTTAALAEVRGVEEHVYWDEALTVALPLVEGDNTIAVEVHQAVPGDPDVRFDLELAANQTIENVAPTAWIASPSDGSHFVEGAGVEVVPEALDQDGQITELDLLVDGVAVASGLASSAPVSVAGLAPGVHRLEVRATDSAGATASHEARVVVDRWLPPVVVITRPMSGDPLPEGQPIEVTAEVRSAPSAPVQRVELFVKEGDFFPTGFDLVNGENYSPVAVATKPPYDLTIPALPAGMHMLQVSAVDEAGHLGVSPHVKILVQSTASATTCPRTDVGGVCMAYRVAGDQDGDGIDNRWDFCPDSLAEAGTGSSSGWVATKAAGGGLAFRASGAKAVQIAGAAPRYEDLGGCTCYQIARELGLEGEGADAGCSVGTLERWRKRIADAARVD